MNDIYENVDKVNEYLTRHYAREFNKYRNIGKFDAINVIKKSKILYEWLYKITKETYFTMARAIYMDYTDEDLLEAWLVGVLDEYDPVTKYQFSSEWERKRARFAESMIASTDKKFDMQLALRLLTQQGTQGAITVADAAQREAYRHNGVVRVRWDSESDMRVCHECHSMHGTVYDLDKVPPKPHYNCRCHLVAVMEGKVK